MIGSSERGGEEVGRRSAQLLVRRNADADARAGTRRTHRTEALLPCRVPQLQPDLAPVDDQTLREEARADGRGERVAEVARGVAVHNRRLADSLATDCNHTRKVSQKRAREAGSGAVSGSGVALTDRRRWTRALTDDDLGLELVGAVSPGWCRGGCTGAQPCGLRPTHGVGLRRLAAGARGRQGSRRRACACG